MQIILELTTKQEAALKAIAAKGNQPATETEPEVIVDPEGYFRARIADVLASYVAQVEREDVEVISTAFRAAPQADRDAVFTALKISRATEKGDAQ
jgi:hypothetical protein